MISLTIPVRLISEANQRGHWRKHAQRHKSHRAIAAVMLRSVMTCRVYPPFVVTITRVAPRSLDSDNLASSAKSLRDGLADQLQVNDNDPRIDWRYAQEKGKPGEARRCFNACLKQGKKGPIGECRQMLQ